MKETNVEELERLVCDMHNGRLSDKEFQRLQELLTNAPESQDLYCRIVDTHMALEAASSSILDNDRTSPTVSPDHSQPSQKPHWRFGLSPWHFATAAVLLLAASLAFFLPGLRDKEVVENDPSHSIITLPSITNVSWDGPTYAKDARDWYPVVAVPAGAIKLHQHEGGMVDGYLFCLPPGKSVDLIATFDATGENSMSLVEIMSGSTPSARKIGFSNVGEGPRPLHANPRATNRRFGVLGQWSETNDSDINRYFLLTCVHKLAESEAEQQWRLSDMAVCLESNSVVHVGWDDSGPAPLKTDGDYRQDNDFDDLTATLFFSPAKQAARSTVLRGVEVIAPNSMADLQLPENLDGGFDLVLEPGDSAVLQAYSDAVAPSAVVVIDTEDNSILWSSVKATTRRVSLGTTGFRNTTSTPKSLRIVAMARDYKSKTDKQKWLVSKRTTLFEQPYFYILGYNDQGDDRDYNDVRVSVLLHSGDTTPAAQP